MIRGIHSGPAPANRDYVAGSWDLYTWRAAPFLAKDEPVPSDFWAWGEGVPNDIPTFEGERVIFIAPPSYERSWSLARTFSALRPSITVANELSRAEMLEWLGKMVGVAEIRPKT